MTAAAPSGLTNLTRAAKTAGMTKKQLKRFLAAGYVPQPKQVVFHGAARMADDLANPREIAFGGARGGGKTHTVFAQIALDDCQRFPGLKALILRKAYKAASEAVEDLRYKILAGTPHAFKTQKSTLIFPNRSKMIVGHFQSEKDIDNYLGLEYDVIAIEEATQLSQTKIEKIKTVNRSSKPDIRPRIYYTTNPGGVGHSWFKQQFVEPWRRGKETDTRFIPSTVRDNRLIDSEYVQNLENLTGWLRKAWLDGDWDVFAGQFFNNFSFDRHVSGEITPEFLKEADLDLWCSLDYGYRHYTAAYLFTRHDGVIYCLDEFGSRLQLVQSNAEGIKQMLGRWSLTPDDLLTFVAGPDVFAKKGDTGTSYADEFAENGIFLRPANNDRVQGAGRILQLLGDEKQGIPPSVKISSGCRRLIESLPALEHNPNRPNDVLKIDTDERGAGGDDFYDAFRYGIMAANTNVSIG